MSEPSIPPDLLSSDGKPDLEAVLAAWHAATLRLERTHETLRNEVRRLTDELEVKNRELARKNRLADLGQMAVHVAHEVRNNLVPVTLYLSLLRRRISDDSGSVDVLNKVSAGFTALEATVNDLLQFSSDRDPRYSTFPLCQVIEEVYESLAIQMSAQAIEFDPDVSRDLLVRADREMIRRAVLNLTLNALDAMPDGGSLVLTSLAGPSGLELEVADTGPGLSEDERQRVFEPFFATKYGQTGLGLAIVYRIAEAHGGEVTAVNCPDGGAAFTLRIPQQTVALEAAA